MPYAEWAGRSSSSDDYSYGTSVSGYIKESLSIVSGYSSVADLYVAACGLRTGQALLALLVVSHVPLAVRKGARKYERLATTVAQMTWGQQWVPTPTWLTTACCMETLASSAGTERARVPTLRPGIGPWQLAVATRT